MTADITKRIERAKKYLEKNKLESAVEEYQAALSIEPDNTEVLQALGDLCNRLGQAAQAARYYGMLFDRCYEAGETNRALVLYQRHLKATPQPPERLTRYATLLQKQDRREEAIEEFTAAAQAFLAQGSKADALRCRERLALLDPENPERHLELAELAEALSQKETAARAYFRAAQLVLADSQLDRALEYFEHADRLTPQERSICLAYAEALLRKNDCSRAVELLEPFAPGEMDAQFQSVFGEALLGAGHLDRARPVLEARYQDKPEGFDKLFQLADAYLAAGQAGTALEILESLKQRLFALKRPNQWVAEFDRIASKYPESLPLAEFGAQAFNELNREAKYFDFLARLFELRLQAGNVAGACDAFDRLVDIDAYDHGHQSRLAALEGKAGPEFLARIRSRLAQVASTPSSGASIHAGGSGGEAQSPRPPGAAEPEASSALEDLIVQAEIFLQYSLGAKVIERLERIAQLFPGEEERNERLRRLYEAANWWPSGPRRGRAVPGSEVAAASYSPETLRDLAKISQINQLIYRQGTPKAVLSAAVNEIGKYLRATRCLAVIGPQGQPPQVAAEFCAPGLEPSPPAQVVKLLARFEQSAPDALGALTLDATVAPVLREIGLETALAVQLSDKETRAPAGLVVVGHAAPYTWPPNEVYFLQAVGDQMLISVNHARLRTLVRTLAVADEKTGLLSRSSYQDCLLNEAGRARMQGTPLALLLLQLDRGHEFARQHGETLIERFLEQAAQKLLAALRQNDLAVKYTAWSLAFILPDTALADAGTLAEKLRKICAGTRPLWDQKPVTFSAAVVEAVARPDYDNEDIVTDLINRAEFALEEARARGGDTVVSLASPKI